MPWGNRKRRVGGSHLAPWQRAFAAAAYNALHAGLASGALRGDCYGTGAICPTDTGSTTPSDVLLDTAADGSTTNFDTQVAVAAAVVYTAWPESARLGQQIAGKEAASLFDRSGRLRPEITSSARQIVSGDKLGNQDLRSPPTEATSATGLSSRPVDSTVRPGPSRCTST